MLPASNRPVFQLLVAYPQSVGHLVEEFCSFSTVHIDANVDELKTNELIQPQI